MRHRMRLMALIICCSLVAAGLLACPKPVLQGERGPSGLPSGRGSETEQEREGLTDVERLLPLYPESDRKAPGVYFTTDPVTTVSSYYSGLLKVSPETRGMYGEVTVFVTADGEVQLISSEGGTEIRFVTE